MGPTAKDFEGCGVLFPGLGAGNTGTKFRRITYCMRVTTPIAAR